MRLSILLFCLLPSLLWGQNAYLSQGIYAYEQGDYPESIRTLSSLIESNADLSGGELPKAHFYLAQSYWQAANNVKYKQDYPQALLRAYNHLVAAQRLDRSTRYTQACNATITLLLPALYEAGTEAYNRRDYALASRYFDRSYQLEPQKYESLMAKAYAQWQMQDSVSALKSWQEVVENPPIKLLPEQLNEFAHAYAMIVHTRSAWGQITQARDVLHQAFMQYPNHPSLIEAELDIYLSHPAIQQNGERHFQEQIRKNQDNLDWKRAYARYLFYTGETEKAIQQFEYIQRLEPDHEMANRFLASHYVSQAKKMLDQLGNSTGEERSAQQEKILEALLESLPYLSKLHEEDPERIDWLEHLIAISEYLDLAKAKVYRKELRKIR
ncbi:MAG: tetratricopeptide repeat protein [Bacteroidota bacterium]